MLKVFLKLLCKFMMQIALSLKMLTAYLRCRSTCKFPCIQRRRRIAQIKNIRHVIFALITILDGRLVTSHLRNLRQYNIKRKGDGLKRIFVTDHLPRQMEEDKKTLSPLFKNSKQEWKEPSWNVNLDNGKYCIYVETGYMSI